MFESFYNEQIVVAIEDIFVFIDIDTLLVILDKSFYILLIPIWKILLKYFILFKLINTHLKIKQGSCSKSGGESTTDDSESAVNTISSSQAEIHLEQPESPMSRKPSIIDQNQQQQQQASSSYQQHQPGMSQNQSASKQPQEKVSFLLLLSTT